MRPGMRHPSPVPPLRPPQRLMPAPNDGGVFFGGRDYARRQQPIPQNYPLPQKPLLPPGTPPQQQWQNNPNYRPGPVPLIRPNGPWHPHANQYHSPSPPPPLLPPHHHHQQQQQQQQFNPNSQTPITYVPPNSTTYELMRIANPDPIPFLEPHEDEDNLVRQHLLSNSNNDESLPITTSSPSKPNKRRRQQQQQQQHENNRNMISYQDLDRPEEQRDPSFDNRLVPKSNKTNHLPSDKTNNQIPIKSSIDNDHALKLELDRIKRAGAQEREKLKAQRQAAAEKEKEAQMKKNSAKTGDKDKREDGELGDSSDDENTKSTPPIEQQKRLKKIVDNLALKPSKTTISYRSKTPPSESILDMSVMKLIRPIKLFHLDDDNNNSYREYLTTNFGRVRVHCHKPQPNFFSNVSCIEEIKRRFRLNTNSSSTILFRHLIDDNDITLQENIEPEDGEIESDEENTMDSNRKISKHMLSDDDNDKHIRKKSKLNEDGMNNTTKSSLNEKPWMTNELRQLIKQRNKLQAQILNGDTNAEIEKKFKKIRNKITKHAKTLKAKYENSISGSSEPSLAPPFSSYQQSSTNSSSSISAATAANHPLSTILDPALVMAMLVNPSLYSHVQQQILSNANFMQAYQHVFAEGNSTTSTNSLPPKVASETQVVPSSIAALDGLSKQTTPKATKEHQNLSSTRSRPVLTQATKPIQLTSLESDFDNDQRNKTKTRFNPSETALTESQQQEIALTQELIRRQLALTQQQQQRNQRNPHSTSQLSLSTPLSRHIPLTTEQMQEVLTRAKNYVTRQQSDEPTDSSNTQPRLSYNTRRLQAALAASASSATPQTAHTIGQAAAAAIAAVSARPSTTAPVTPGTPPITKTTPSSSNSVVTPPIPPSPQHQQHHHHQQQQQQQQLQQQHPIRIQLDQKSKTLSSISNNQSLPIPTISQQKLMPLVDVNHSPPPHMYQNPPNWQRPPHLPVSHYPMPPHQQQYPPYDNPHPPPYYGPRTNYPPDIRPPPQSYGPLPPRHLSQPPRYNGPLPPPGPYGYGHPPQNYGPPPLPHPHYGHHYPPS